jgi:hypothetical protein
MVRRIARNQVFLVAKHYPASLLRQYWWPIFVGQALWGMLALRHGAGWSFAAGKLEGLQRFGSMRQAQDGGQLARILEDGERQIREAQSRAGFDWYWKMYFALTAQSRRS